MYGHTIDRAFALKRHADMERRYSDNLCIYIGHEAAEDLLTDKRILNYFESWPADSIDLSNGEFKLFGIPVKASSDVKPSDVKLVIEIFG